MSGIRVVLADDHAVFRAGLTVLLNNEPDIEVIGEAADGKMAIQQSLALGPDVVVMDIAMSGIGGVEATRQLKRQNPEIKVLPLTVHEESEYLDQMINAGADGYVPKKAAGSELVQAIRVVNRGEHFIHPSMAGGLMERVRNGIQAETGDDGLLSLRETEILRLVALGYTDREIADKVCLSLSSVKTYKARLKAKLGLRRRAQLVQYAAQKGLLTTEA